MARRLDDDAAFQFYVALGETRTHGQVARKFGVTPRAIRKAAKRAKWNARLDRIELEAQARLEERLVETRVETHERHLRMLRAIATRGLHALQRSEINTAMDGVRAIEIAIKMERTILGDASERVGVSIEEMTRREIETFVTTTADPEDPDDDEPDEP